MKELNLQVEEAYCRPGNVHKLSISGHMMFTFFDLKDKENHLRINGSKSNTPNNTGVRFLQSNDRGLKMMAPCSKKILRENNCDPRIVRQAESTVKDSNICRLERSQPI